MTKSQVAGFGDFSIILERKLIFLLPNVPDIHQDVNELDLEIGINVCIYSFQFNSIQLKKLLFFTLFIPS